MLLQALCIILWPLVNLNWSYSPETPNLGQIRRFLEPCDLEIWWMTLKKNRAPLLSNIKLCASFHHHMWIQTGVRVWKRLSWVLTSVTLTFDLWPWPFAWTSLLSLVINFMMIRWWEHSQKGVTDRQTDGRKIPFIKLLGRSWKYVVWKIFIGICFHILTQYKSIFGGISAYHGISIRIIIFQEMRERD